MSNKFKEIYIKKFYRLHFWWYDQYKMYWSKENQNRWIVIQKYF